MRRGILFSLGNARDGVSIKILVWRQIKPSSTAEHSRQGNIGRHHVNPVISKRRKWTSHKNKIIIECYLLSEPRIRGYRKSLLSFMAAKGYILGIRTKIS